MRLCWNEKKNGFVVNCYLSMLMLIFFYSFYKIKDRNGNGSIYYIFFLLLFRHHVPFFKFQIFFCRPIDLLEIKIP